MQAERFSLKIRLRTWKQHQRFPVGEADTKFRSISAQHAGGRFNKFNMRCGEQQHATSLTKLLDQGLSTS